MLRIGSILFPIRVVPMKIENFFKRHFEKPPKINYTNMSSLLKSSNFDAAKIKCFTVYWMGKKIFQCCTCPAGRVIYNFHSSSNTCSCPQTHALVL